MEHHQPIEMVQNISGEDCFVPNHGHTLGREDWDLNGGVVLQVVSGINLGSGELGSAKEDSCDVSTTLVRHFHALYVQH